MGGSNGFNKRSILGGRRRSSSSRPTGRAETPTRWRTTGGGSSSYGSPSSGGGSSTGFGLLGAILSMLGSSGSSSSGRRGCLPSGKGCLFTIIILIVIILVFVSIYFLDCGNLNLFNRNPDTEKTTTQSSTYITQSSINTTTYNNTYTPSGEQKWLVMLYQDADDNVLEKDIYTDLNEAEKAGSSEEVTIVSQIDRYNGAYSGDGNWTGTKRFLISQDNNLERLASQEIASLGELNMSLSSTLVDFVTWAINTYPADKYALILSDHGMGWPGGWTDSTPSGNENQDVPIVNAIGDMLYLNELDEALNQIRLQTGINKLDVIGLDACLMAQLEVFTALAPHARYAVASEETEPAIGWAYYSFLHALNQNPDMSGAELSSAIVESYLDEDELITSNSQRDAMSKDITLTAIDLSKIAALNNNLNQLAFMFQNTKQQVIAGSRTYAQSYTSVFGSDVPNSYIDLGNMLKVVKQKNSSSEINNAINNVLASIDDVVVAEKHGIQKDGSTGISIYFPNSQLYGYSISGSESYTAIAGRFATESLWDDFLAYHYTGRNFELSDAQAVVPDSSSVSSPAAGGINISAILASATEVDINSFISLSADISGENIGYIYIFTGYLDKNANSIFVADQDFIESPNTRFADGIYYPNWGEGDFNLQFDWEPIVFAISDGNNSVTTWLEAEIYGASSEEAVYSVRGIFNDSSENKQYYAKLYFSNGSLQKVTVYSGSDYTGAPREIKPENGDKFTVTETWLDLNNYGKVTSTVTQEGKTLTFGSGTFTWEVLYAAAGSYMIGFIVEDMDGNMVQSLIEITVL